MNKRPISTQIHFLLAQNGMSLSAALTEKCNQTSRKKGKWPTLARGDVELRMRVER